MEQRPQPRKKAQKGFDPSVTGTHNLKAFDEHQEHKGITGMHYDNLYDMQEDVAGQKIDEGTGKKIDNTQGGSYDNSDFTVRKIAKKQKGADVMGDLTENDAAAKWLKENDPEQNTKH